MCHIYSIYKARSSMGPIIRAKKLLLHLLFDSLGQANACCAGILVYSWLANIQEVKMIAPLRKPLEPTHEVASTGIKST